MAEKTIGELPKATTIYDDSAFVMEQNGHAMQTDSETLKDYFFGEGTNNLIVNCNTTTMTADKTATEIFAAVDAGKGVKMYTHASGDLNYKGADFIGVSFNSQSEEWTAYFVARVETSLETWKEITYIVGGDGSVAVYDEEEAVSTTRPSTIKSGAALSLSFTPTANAHAVNKKYVDDAIQVVQETGVYSVNGQTGNVLINVPTRVGQLTNDSGFLTESPGAEYVPFTPTSGVNEDNVQDAIENVQAQIAGAVAGSIPDNSIALAKLVQSELTVLREKYMVGDIYITTNEMSDPFTVLGYGQWIKLEGKFLLGSSSTRGVGDTGGNETHQLTVNEMPSHSHRLGVQNPNGTQSGGSKLPWALNQKSIYYGGADMIESTGGSQAFNIMPPYFVVNMWLRVA